MLVGMDLGSVSLNTVVLDGSWRVIYERYTRIQARPVEKVLEELSHLFKEFGSFKGLAFTGTGGKFVASILNASFVNEIIAHARGIVHFHPEIRTILDIGGEDSKIIELSFSETGETLIRDFSMNTMCAAGTGSFLDQQASRLGVSIEDEFGEMALRSKNPPRIAGRCSVFAKSDMIHLQQEATPDYDIVAGLCFAMIRNFKGTQGKGRVLERPFSLQGGVAANAGIVRAVKEVFELKDDELIIPEHFTSIGAVGTVLHSFERKKEFSPVREDIINSLEGHIRIQREKVPSKLEPLKIIRSERRKSAHPLLGSLKGQRINVFLGIDVGSISTNVVAINEEGEILSKRYLMTAGRPIEAVKKGLAEVGKELGKLDIDCLVRSCGTTGSGRYLIGELVGADIVKNEITAQARAAAEIDPDVDTIFEIGGQDSKYISLENGVVVDFEMNKVCAAGTGSFLEEQAIKLEISIEDEFGKYALNSRNPVKLGERCTVFMESDIVAHQQKGAKTEDLVGGLSYSIVLNYLNRVVADKKVGNNIFFQGGVAFNDGVLAAFENVTGKKITVPPHHEVTGAIGIALIARDEARREKSDFVGFDLDKKDIRIQPFECQGCSNLCEVKKVVVDKKDALYFGSRCEKYEVKKKKSNADVPDLFMEREKLLMQNYDENSNLESDIVIGIPRSLTFFELFPLYSAFFSGLGCKIILSEKTNKKIVHLGSELVNAEVCLPVKVAHGHVHDLVTKGVDCIFIPSVIDMEGFDGEFTNNFNCPYVQTIPYMIKAALELKEVKVKILAPVLRFQLGSKGFIQSLINLGKKLGFKKSVILQAMDKALQVQRNFKDSLKKKGEELEELIGSNRTSVVIVSRAYNGFDLGLNLNLPRKFRDLGVLPIPLDFLPLDGIKLPDGWENMYWQYGQKFLKASEYVKSKPGLYAVYITNFSCGPDSFLTTFFKKLSGSKPFLQIELDEHSADAGVITRCEAFIDSLKNLSQDQSVQRDVFSIYVPDENGGNRKLYIPRMCDHSVAIEAAFKLVDVEAEIMAESDYDTLYYGRKYTSGKECYPCIVTTGDIVKTCLRDDFDPEKSAFFMPSTSGPCRFGQYNKLQKIVVEDLGFKDVIFVTPNQDTHKMYESSLMIPSEFFKYAWLGVVAIDYLDKLLRRIRPYELNEDETEQVYREVMRDVLNNLNSSRFHEALIDGVERFRKIPADFSVRKPIVGIVGEVFVRANSFSNNDIVKKIEALGGEVWIPPIIEWINYTNYIHLIHALENNDYIGALKTILKNHFQRKHEFRIASVFSEFIEQWREPRPKEILEISEKYISPAYEGEAILSVGKSIEFIKSGASGIVNTMPFTCMPGTIVASILKRVRAENDDIPFLNLCYDGQEDINESNRLEAFMHQAHQVCSSRKPTNINLKS